MRIDRGAPRADNDDEEWLRVLDVNAVGIARVSAAALLSLRRSSTPVIVNTASILSPADPGSGPTSGTVLPVDGGRHDLLLRPVD